MSQNQNTAPKRHLKQPRIFIEVMREIDDTGQFIRSRKEIDLRVWRDARFGAVILTNELEACLKEIEQYGS